ncbi:MAG: hypothetical protein PHY04_03655 [Candidatus ainarchaeum sp.]|jgi:hypothetical protein|nr:hypothetical protein [Candidatus ainarchaeum sp.]MDD3086190.1 hypothetical protein [Candidatus ainarchaeum sp.]MDD4128803.1 hypothetical protein [Candidatus ainarchaeum sp.]MDD4468135.1 hypothetical protein [Candidatus ainarchaeum sp.]HPM86278.1 hypothetical protein [archaeon]
MTNNKKNSKKNYLIELEKDQLKKKLYNEAKWKKNILGSTDQSILEAGKK